MSFTPSERTSCRLVATPIGNLKDMTPRALEALSEADIIFAEDTRTAAALLSHFSISKPLKSCHKDNEQSAVAEIMRLLGEGTKIALISEAGMPGISDPGFILINELIKNGKPFEVIPGVSAAVHAAVASGLCKDGRYLFYGFLPHKGAEGVLEELQKTPFPVIFYEAPHRLEKTVELLLKHFPPPVALCKELTKIHEEIAHIYNVSDLKKITIRGEFCLVVDNSAAQSADTEGLVAIAPEKLAESLAANGVPVKSIAEILKSVGIKRNLAYKIAQESAKE